MKTFSNSLLSFAVVLCIMAPLRSVAQETNCPGTSMSIVWGCESTTSGWATVENIVGLTGPLSWLWSTEETSEFVNDLPNGEHWVMVTDAQGCYIKDVFTVGCWLDPDCTLGLTIEYGCLDTTSGWASVNVTGATGPTSILWSTGETAQYVSGLPNGDHWVWIQEAPDCWVKQSFTIDCEMDPDCPLEVTMEQGCDDMGGWATITEIVGANADTEVHWSTGEQSMGITGLVDGTYYAVIMNSETCWHKEHFEIECGTPSDCDFDVAIDWGCLDTTSAWATVNVTGAVEPTTILWSTGETVQYASGFPNGQHWVMVTDGDDCTVQEFFTVACQMDPDCPLEVGMEHGCDDNGGWASIGEISGANASTEVHWSTGEQTMSIDSLTDGSYYLVVMNSETCWLKEHFLITCDMDPDCELTATADWGCLDTLTAWGTVDVTGATDVTSILWSNGATTQYVDDLPNGDHWVMVSQAEDCWAMDMFTVSCEMDLDCPLEVSIDYGCGDLFPGSYAMIDELIGANAETEIHWSNGVTGTLGVNDLPDGDHYVVVMNSETCWSKSHFTLECEDGMVPNGNGIGVNLYPVPANNVLGVDLQAGTTGGVISMILMDGTGRTMITHGNEALQAGASRTVSLSLDNVNNGSYLLTILKDGVIVSTQRVVVAR